MISPCTQIFDLKGVLPRANFIALGSTPQEEYIGSREYFLGAIGTARVYMQNSLIHKYIIATMVEDILDMKTHGRTNRLHGQEHLDQEDVLLEMSA